MKHIYDKVADKFKCGICGEWHGGLCYHIWRKHQITVDEYRKQFRLIKREKLLSKIFRKKKKETAMRNGTYRNVKEGGEKQRERLRRGEVRICDYERSEETKAKLRMLRRNYEIKKYRQATTAQNQ